MKNFLIIAFCLIAIVCTYKHFSNKREKEVADNIKQVEEARFQYKLNSLIKKHNAIDSRKSINERKWIGKNVAFEAGIIRSGNFSAHSFWSGRRLSETLYVKNVPNVQYQNRYAIVIKVTSIQDVLVRRDEDGDEWETEVYGDFVDIK